MSQVEILSVEVIKCKFIEFEFNPIISSCTVIYQNKHAKYVKFARKKKFDILLIREKTYTDVKLIIY